MTLICIRQPGYMPYLGFFKKIQTSDLFVYFDDAQYAIRAWDNRNKIYTNKGPVWISVPVSHPFKKKLNEVEINNDLKWKEEHSAIIKLHYEKCPYFTSYWNDVHKIIMSDWKKLVDLNIALIEYFNTVLEINTKTIRSSELNIDATSSEKLLQICKRLNADTYLSGIMGREYIDEKIFAENGIKIIFENFVHPQYDQIHGNFIPNMAIIDLLFNEGDKSKKILRECSNF